MAKPVTFNNVSEAIDAANYVQQLLGAEYQWINNRVSWLFISQSFCITAYTILATSTGVRFAGRNTISILEVGLPVFGIISCATVGVAVFAATRVARRLARERVRLTLCMNENSPVTISLVGAESDLRKDGWTYWSGELPHWILPWVLAVLWLLIII